MMMQNISEGWRPNMFVILCIHSNMLPDCWFFLLDFYQDFS